MRKQQIFDIDTEPTNKNVSGLKKTSPVFDNVFEPGPSLHLLNTTKNILALVIISGLVVFIIFARIFQIQLIQGADYRLRSDTNRVRTIVTPAPRGEILDRYGNSLAVNIPNISLTITPADLPKNIIERDSVLRIISESTGIPLAEIDTSLSSKIRRLTDPVVIRERIPYDEAMRYLIALVKVPAVSVVSLPNRYYPTGIQTAGLVGYTGRVTTDQLAKKPEVDPLTIFGITGLEYTYNNILTGQDGITSIERDAQNREQRIVARQEPLPGKTLITTIDSNLQKILYEKLNSTVSSIHAPGGAAIIINPNNGEILALASATSYDNNVFVSSNSKEKVNSILTDKKKPLLNRAISGQYPSGSIVKPFIAAAALSERLITRSTTINSVGGFKVGNNYFPDWKNGGHGQTNIIKAISESVNTFFYAIGGGLDQVTGLGVDRIISYLKKFGWGQKTDIDIPAEADGFLPTKEWRTTKRPSPWKLGDTYHLSIGQGDIAITPLQAVTAIAAIANGGTLYKPFIVKEIRQADGQSTQNNSAQIAGKQIVSTAVLKTVQAGMRESVISGSSRSLQSLPVTSAGKTGTAQFGNNDQTHAWFTAYLPHDHPTIAIIVLIESGGEGSATALPVAREVLNWYFTAGAGKP